LREGIRAKGQTESWAAEHTFHVVRPCMSGWLNGRYRPNADHREVARDAYGVPMAAWDTRAERGRRLERLKNAAVEPPTDDAPVSSRSPAAPLRGLAAAPRKPKNAAA
jgi:hypothetical protein